ncbi:MAG: adenylosuccinate synthase [Oscillospiraceae bacterium]|jgi:adenylosuccinate synthase|nr:adenylosuccinate synthase [Oscillospiraceae bacterium]
MLTAVVGVNWGDEGKGRMVDLLSEGYDVICRYQGGNNAGHTVVNDRGKFILNLLPSGVLRDGAVNVMGCGMVVNIEHLCGEIAALAEKGVTLTPDTLQISDKAVICLPYHVQQDIWEEERLGDQKYGSTRRGIAPVYGDKSMHKGLRMGDLLEPETLKDKLSAVLEWKNLTLKGYGPVKIDLPGTWRWLGEYGTRLRPYVADTTQTLSAYAGDGKNILFEAQLGTLRDIDYGIYPYTTSSQTLASYATTGAGIPGSKLDRVIGVMKAYSSAVGGGPFAVEMSGAEADALREAGAEYGAATGRPRRVGAFDVVASRYGAMMQGADELALTKLDVLSYMEKIPVCTAYEIDGVKTDRFPAGSDRLTRAKPVYDYLGGFKTDISKCRKPGDLPDAALGYIRYIEEAVGRPITYVSVGPERNDYLVMR